VTSLIDRRSLGATLRWGRAVLLLALAAFLHTGAASEPAGPSASTVIGRTNASNVRQDLQKIRDAVRVDVMDDRGKLPPLTPGGVGPFALPSLAPSYPAGAIVSAQPIDPEGPAWRYLAHSHHPRAPPLTA
jgi:hypothetical protein